MNKIGSQKDLHKRIETIRDIKKKTQLIEENLPDGSVLTHWDDETQSKFNEILAPLYGMSVKEYADIQRRGRIYAKTGITVPPSSSFPKRRRTTHDT